MKDATATLILYACIVHTSSVVVYCYMWNSLVPRCSTKFVDICWALGNEAACQITPLSYLHRDNLLQLLHIFCLQVYGAAQLHKAETLSCSLPTTSQHYSASLKPVSDEKQRTHRTVGGTRSMTVQGKYNNSCHGHWCNIIMQVGPGLVSLLASEVEQGRCILNNWVGEQ